MPTLRIAFIGMIVGGAAFLMSGMAVYLATAELQYRTLAQLQDRPVQAQRTWTLVRTVPTFAVI